MPTFDLDGLDVFFREQGRGPGVLLVHCAGSSSGQWRSLSEQLEGRYRVLAPDLYGHGRTPPWPGVPGDPSSAFTLDDEARLLTAVAGLAEEPVHVVGHSYGGASCVQLALRYPERVRSLVVVEPTLFGVLPDAGRDRQWAEVEGPARSMIDLAVQGRPVEGARMFLEFLMGPGAWEAWPPERREELAAQVPVTIVRECRAQMFDGRVRRDQYAEVTAPTWLLVGTRSPASLRGVSEVLVETMPSARLVSLPGADHMAPISSPDAVAEVVERVLAEVSSGR